MLRNLPRRSRPLMQEVSISCTNTQSPVTIRAFLLQGTEADCR